MQDFPISDFDTRDWPKNLFEMSHIPKALFIRGLTPKHNQKFLTVIGPRRPSEYSVEVTKFLISGLRGLPICIVSGLAFGIDSLAHKVALENNLDTIAFPGSGLDESVLYPQSHLGLAREILRRQGALVSEYQNFEKARPYFFPQRNRLMAGIADAVLIIEASKKSGSMITARFALDYGRDVMCVPGSIFNPNANGVNYLIGEGAIPICSPDEIIQVLSLSKEKESINYDSLPNLDKQILTLLRQGFDSDQIIHKTGINSAKYNQIISSLEIEGLL